MSNSDKLTLGAIENAIKSFVTIYNNGYIDRACQFYADKVLYYDGHTTDWKSRAEIISDMQHATTHIVGSGRISVLQQSIYVSIDARSALVQLCFIIDKNMFGVQMTVEQIDGRPQVTYDRTIAI